VRAAKLEQDERQQQAAVGAVMTVTAAHWVLKDGEVFQVAKAEAGEAEFGTLTACANHVENTIRAWSREVQSPPEELLLGHRFRCNLGIDLFHEE
jgi:hypothetical protein